MYIINFAHLPGYNYNFHYPELFSIYIFHVRN
jgi:hypothetical protein